MAPSTLVNQVLGHAYHDGTETSILRRLALSPTFRIALVVAFAVLVAARIPDVFLTGRFWAEEGALFYRNALLAPWWVALTTVHTGYVNLIANTATLFAAHVAGLENAPRVTATIGLAVQLLPAIVLATGGLTWLRSNWILAVALLIIATPPASEEVWINSITSQFHMMLAAALVLMAEPTRGWVRWFYLGILILAPLTGPGAIMLAPLFVLRAVLDRSPRRIEQAAVLVTASLVQFTVIVLHPEPARAYPMSPGLLASVMYVKHVLVPLAGPWSERMALAVHDAAERGRWPVRALVLPPVLFASFAVAVGASRYKELAWPFAAGLVFALLSYFGAVANKPTDLLYWWVGGRYSYAPAVLFGLTALGLACETRSFAYAARALVPWILIVGLLNYFRVLPSFASGPDWQREVAAWRAGSTDTLRFWPDGPEWRFSPPRPLP
jgi:hypothetical protein